MMIVMAGCQSINKMLVRANPIHVTVEFHSYSYGTVRYKLTDYTSTPACIQCSYISRYTDIHVMIWRTCYLLSNIPYFN